MTRGIDAPGEFETIARMFAPLAHPEWARGLTDDVAVLPTRSRHDLVLTQDALVEGVHFLPGDPYDLVARKLLRVNLSDLACKGAEPFGYLLTCVWPDHCGLAEREAFAAGLAEDQAAFGIALLGGDTVRASGPAMFSATLLGWRPRGHDISRAGAREGDVVLVTGAIGDGVLGLKAAQGLIKLEAPRLEALIAHYRLPEPRLAFGPVVRDHASAAIDVSDGLVADLGHIARNSGVGIVIDLERVPLSRAATAWFEHRVDPEAALVELATGGDDYEIALTAPPAALDGLKKAAEDQLLRLTQIGVVTGGEGVAVRFGGASVEIATAGWRHD